MRFILLVLLFFVNVFSSNLKPITIGIAPHSSARVILTSHNDLKVFFEKYFHRKVNILTAKNFSEFSKRSNKGVDFDLILTSPNLAILAQELGGYTPLMTYKKGLTTIVLSKDKDILSKNKNPLKVIGLDPVSFPTLDAQQWLSNKGLDSKISYTYTSATDSSITILMNNRADMIIMSLPNYLKLIINNKKKDLVNVIYKSKPKPSRIYLAKNKNGITLAQWKEALTKFSSSVEGKHHLEVTRLQNFKKITNEDLDNLDEIVKKTKKRLYK